MFSLALALLPVISTVLGLPTLGSRQSSAPWCEGLGDGAFDTASNFTLVAYNGTDDQVGEPLVVGIYWEISAVASGVLATASSVARATTPYGPSPFLGFNLTSGALLPLPAPGLGYDVYASDYEGEGGSVAFDYSTLSWQLDPPAQIYCAVADTDPTTGTATAQLAIDQQLDLFSLCINNLGYNQVVHNATAQRAPENDYDFDSCYPVTLTIVEDY